MVARAGVYLRANIDEASGETLAEEMTLVGGESAIPELTFVDLQTRLPISVSATERLTAALQDRLHLVASSERVLFRWPWLLGPGDDSQVQLIDDWLGRLTDVSGGEPVIPDGTNLGVIQHRVADVPLLRWAGDAPVDIGGCLSHARAVELHALLRRSNAVWEPTTYHYRLPNGEHTDTFVRLADAVQSPQDAYVIASWLTDRLSNGVGIVVDTGGLTPVLIQIESFLARFNLELGPTAILQSYPSGRPVVRRTVESAINSFATSIIGIQSVSSTGGLLRTFTDELERAAGSWGMDHSLDVLVDRSAGHGACSRFAPEGDARVLPWLGLGEKSGVALSGSCDLCRDPERAQYVAVDPRTYGEMALPAPHLVMPNTTYADAGHLFWERVSRLRALAIEANPHPRSRVARGKRTALPVRPIFELIASSDGMNEVIRARRAQLSLSDEVSNDLARTSLIVASSSDFATVAQPAFAGGADVNLEVGLRSALTGLGLDPSLPIVADDDGALPDRIAALSPEDAVLVFSWGSVTGLTLRRLKLAVADVLRSQSKDQSVNGLVFHSRPSTPREWSALQNQFRPGFLLDLWTSCFPWDSPLTDERRLLDRAGLNELDLSPRARAFLNQRTRFLDLHSVHSSADDDWSPRFGVEGAPDPEHIFWGMSREGTHQSHVRGRSLYGKGLDCLNAYAAIGSTIHYTRLTERPTAAPRWVMFDLGRLVRSYFDAVITCSAIRWLQPGELWWGGDTDDADSARDSIAYLLDQAADELDEQVLLVPELLLACAQGKVPVAAHDVVRVRAEQIASGWPETASFEMPRGAVEIGLALLALG